MKQTQYIVDINGKHWLPPHNSRAEGWARYAWFRKKMGVEGVTASEEHWKELTDKYPIRTCIKD